MGIYIKGIDLPNSGQIEIIIRPHGKVWIETKGIGRAEAFQIPTPHGRLIDENAIQGALMVEAYKNDGKFQWGDTIKWTPSEVGEIISNNVPTILEVEE